MKSSENRDGRMMVKIVVFLAVMATGGLVIWSLTETPNSNSASSLVSKPPSPPPSPSPQPKNTSPDVAYVGDQACTRCHAKIAESFGHHPMGRSMATPEKILPEASGKVLEFRDLAYWIERRDGRVFHQERKKSPDGKPDERAEHEVRYVIGSGKLGYSFLVERADGLFFSPISWNSQDQDWDLAPGYQRRNQHFDKKLNDDCLFCHSNRFEKVEGKPIVFDGLSIGCERCHGPGSLHVEHPEHVKGGDSTIVNPAKLKPVALRESVCEQCHIQGIRRAKKYEGSLFDYRPGLPLENYFNITPERFGVTRQLRSIGHVQQMHDSRCYNGSNKELGCISCHDPHKLPEPSERITYYQKRCLECHGNRGCKLASDVRLKQSPKNDCISCHMPRLPSSGIGHAAITDHAIPRQQ